MSSQIEKLHILNLFAKRLRDCRITLKTYFSDMKGDSDTKCYLSKNWQN